MKIQILFKFIFVGLILTIFAACSYQYNGVDLGKLQTGQTFSFILTKDNDWGIEISGNKAPVFSQQKPIQIEILQSNDSIIELTSGYQIVEKSDSCVNASAELKYNKRVVFKVHDRWTLDSSIASLQRIVEVEGNTVDGFNTAFQLKIDSSISWTEVNCLAPGIIYGDPTFDGDRSPGGTLNYKAKRIFVREDYLPAPLFALSFKNGFSVAMLNPTPNGGSTMEETKLKKDVMTDERFQFGAIGAWQSDQNPIEFGYQYPGTMSIYPYGPDSIVKPRIIRRYHPVKQGIVHTYTVSFRFGQNESFQNVTRNTWRWAWSTLKPAVTPIDVEQMRKVLIDHLASQAATVNGRTAIPFAVATFDTINPQWNWSMAAMGFVSKNIECADQLLRESDRDSTERGKKMRQIGLSIISSMIKALPTVPLQATGYDLKTGKPWDHIWLAPWLRNATEDMRVLMRAYRRELALGRQHPEWFKWVKNYVDWLILQQREDGSFPRRWEKGSNKVAEPSGTTSYSPVPLLVIMSEETGDPKYMQSAVHAAEYIWTNYGAKGLFIGGASDNPNITDKEAGMLSMEAFLSLYDSNKDPKWMERAKVAADFTESWIWIWNLPMPIDADNAKLHYKKGLPTVGLQGITARSAGGSDEYLDWAVPSYAKLYKYTNDEHYLDVARILLHNTKSMVALPGRQYNMRATGFQQEGFRMGPGGNGRGMSGHQFWLPWISANHLYGITGMEELDPLLFKQLCKGE